MALTVADVFSQTAPVSGVSSAQMILAKADLNQKIPESAKESLLNTLETIEKSSFVRVPYSQMSMWRKEQFEKAVTEWASQFPQPDDQTEIIIKAHEAQRLLFIAQLFVIPPLSHNSASLKKAYAQLIEIEHLVQNKVVSRLAEISKEMGKKNPILGNTFALSAVGLPFHCAFQPEDDLNPFQRTPLSDDAFAKLKSQISSIMSKKLDIQEVDLHHIVEIKQNKEREQDIPLMVDSITKKMSYRITDDFRFLFWNECLPLITKAYDIRMSEKIDNEYRGYAAELEQLVDSSAVRKAFDEYIRLRQTQTQKWMDDRKKEFEMVVASQPKEPVYELPAATSLLRRITILAIINVIGLLLIFYWALKRRNLRHKLSDKEAEHEKK